ncbi:MULTISPECIES: hypothetical protein [unclassified Streptomyces]|jgi:hypothetical protein|uniref:hypothetical protein n=1 Tax=unclassified Streptomyces TaxID=2593676 RepID=UPI0016533453|nr:hypothetical protein [Streptomyces sp. sk2.1]
MYVSLTHDPSRPGRQIRRTELIGVPLVLAVCPAGVEDDVRPDLVLTPADLLTAWGA